MAFVCDVTDPSQVESAFASVVESMGAPAILINNAGITRDSLFHKMSEQQWDEIMNVHVKDRRLGGTTVPLGDGAANFESVFTALKRAGYTANFILQTARASDGDHVGVLCRYRDMTVDWLRCA